MTIQQLYRRAATLRLAHQAANARTAALDVITSRRVLHGGEHDSSDPCRCNTCAWRRCGARAARVTMDRGFQAAVMRNEARDRLLEDVPWKFERAALEKR